MLLIFTKENAHKLSRATSFSSTSPCFDVDLKKSGKESIRLRVIDRTKREEFEEYHTNPLLFDLIIHR